MKIYGPLIKGRFHSRPNRFITIVDIDGKLVESHLPDPGRLKELLIFGSELYLRPENKKTRKTRYTTVLIKYKNKYISLVSTLPNKFIKDSLLKNNLPIFKNYKIIKQEVKIGRHRFDFLLEDSMKMPFYLEIKSVTFVKKGIAKFPDAVTIRGTKHALALSALARQGIDTGILFVCQRQDGNEFQLMWDIDPDFGDAIVKAKSAGVKIWCITCKITKRTMTYYREIPVNFN